MDKNKKYLIFFLFSALVGLVNGLFGGGGGMLCVPFLKKTLSLSDKRAHATTVLVMSIISIPTLIVYLLTLEYDFGNLLLVSIGSLIGGFFGSKMLTTISDKFLNILFILVLVLSGVKMFI